MALGYRNTMKAVCDHVCEEDKLTEQIVLSGQNRKAIFINESGLYALILSSKLESAKRFKRWVTSEVLPAIRKQGGYMMVREDESNEVILARALQIMQTAVERRDAEIARLKPKADYADKVLNAVSCFTTLQMTKGMGMTAIELNRLLCAHKIQHGQSGSERL